MTKIKGPSGAVIDVSPQQARGLVRDGFASYVDEDAKKEGEALLRRAQGEAESAQFAVGRMPKHVQQAPTKVKGAEAEPEQPEEDEPEEATGDQPEAPEVDALSARASRQELVDHAVQHGAVQDAEELQGKTKDEIRELIDGSTK